MSKQDGVQVVRKKLSDFHQNPDNPVAHSPRNFGLVVNSVRDLGALRSGVSADGKILAGNLTWEAMAEAGIEDVLEVTTDGKTWVVVNREDLSEEQQRAAAYYDQRSSGLSTWDAEQLFRDVEAGMDTKAMWSDEELAELLESIALESEVEDDPGAQIDRASELQEQWGTKLGQIWTIGRHRLACGDCTDKAVVDAVMMGEKVDVLFFDPEWDEQPSPPDGFQQILAFADGATLGKTFSLFGAPTWLFSWDCVTCWYTPNRPLKRMKLCAWYGDIGDYDFDGSHYGDSGKTRTVRNTRGKYVFRPDPRGKHLADVFQSPIVQEHSGSEHPHNKPLDWIILLLANCTSGSVFDPFAGSGTTMAAAERLGRTCLGVEIEPSYCAVILERLSGMGLTPELVSG